MPHASSVASPRLLVIGVNHHTAPLDVRESVAFSPARLTQALEQFKIAHPAAELVILSTCNRVELYVGGRASGQPSADELIAFLATIHGIPAERFQSHIYQHTERAAVEHLFRVAASLDSMVVGETQILAQVKDAYHTACAAGTVGQHCPRADAPPHQAPHATETNESARTPDEHHPNGVFHALFQRAFAAAKAVHDQTDLAAGRVSIASVAVDLARSVFDRFDDKTVLCIGAGKMSSLVLRHLRQLGPRQIHITNRSYDRAAALAAAVTPSASSPASPPALAPYTSPIPVTAVEFSRLDDLLIEADIILTSTGSTEPVITAARFKALLKPRRYRPVVIVDIAVPRDVEPAVGQLRNVYLYNIDDLDQVSAANRDKRSSEIEHSHALLTRHVEEFMAWHAARHAGPQIRALFEQARRLAREELDEFTARHPDLPAADRRDLERLMHRLVGKMLHGPISEITRHTPSRAPNHTPSSTSNFSPPRSLDPSPPAANSSAQSPPTSPSSE